MTCFDGFPCSHTTSTQPGNRKLRLCKLCTAKWTLGNFVSVASCPYVQYGRLQLLVACMAHNDMNDNWLALWTLVNDVSVIAGHWHIKCSDFVEACFIVDKNCVSVWGWRSEWASHFNLAAKHALDLSIAGHVCNTLSDRICVLNKCFKMSIRCLLLQSRLIGEKARILIKKLKSIAVQSLFRQMSPREVLGVSHNLSHLYRMRIGPVDFPNNVV